MNNDAPENPSSSPGERVDRIVVTIHGIRTYGDWQGRLGRLLETYDGTRSVHYVYGYFSVLAFLVPPLRWLVTRRFRETLLRTRFENPTAEVSVVAHSFGTHIVAWALRGIPPYLQPRIDTVVLAGSVLRPTFRWDKLMATGAVRRVVNDCGINDSVLLLNQLVVLLTGMAGRIGFFGLQSDRFVNRFFRGGHSHYFEGLAGRDPDAFMREYWVPVLAGGPAIVVDQRGTPTFLGGVWQTICQNAEPIKLLAYGACFALPFLLWQRVRTREEVQMARGREQAALALAERRRADSVATVAVVAQQGEAIATQKAKDEHEGKLTAQLRTEQTKEDLEAAIDLVEKHVVRVPFNRGDLNDTTIRLVMAVLSDAKRYGYRGRVRIEGHVGQFCVMGESSDPYIAPDSLPMKKCQFYPGSDAYAVALGMRFSQMLKQALIDRNIFPASSVDITSYGEERPALPMPTKGTAKEWNRAARQNNRIEIVFIGMGGDPL